MRVVLDVNIWISGLLWRGNPKQILDLAQNGEITIISSEAILSELEDVLNRARLQPRMQLLGITVEDLMEVTHQLSENCTPISVDVPQLRDPDDAVILGTAVTARVEAVVTGDLDLLVLEKFEDIPILTPADFLDKFLRMGA